MKSVTILIILFPIVTLAQNVNVAKEYYRYNLTDKAKEEFILTFQSSKSSNNDKAESLYWLGQISFDENNYTGTGPDVVGNTKGSQ